eukprot:4439905-Prorocentrum_lima.AAC.1
MAPYKSISLPAPRTGRKDRKGTSASICAPTAGSKDVHSHWHRAVRAGRGLASFPCGTTLCGHWGLPGR